MWGDEQCVGICASLPVLQNTSTHSLAGLSHLDPFLLTCTFHPGDTWFFSAPVLGSRPALCGLEGAVHVPMCLGLAEAQECFGQPLLLCSPPSPLKVPCICSGVRAEAVPVESSVFVFGWGWLCPPAACSTIRPCEGSSSGQGTLSSFSLCKLLLAEGSVSRTWCRNRQ